LLLLSATPHQGKTAGFQRIMALLDRDVFITSASIRREKVVPFVIRTGSGEPSTTKATRCSCPD
jgi:hypothetical protein